MRTKTQMWYVPVTALLVALAVVILAVVVFGLTVFIPATGTMEPLIVGRSMPGDPADVAVIRTRFPRSRLRKGDIVWAQLNYKNQQIDALRMVAAGPGDAVRDTLQTNIGERVPEGMFVLLATTTNAVDSRVVGLVEDGQILGKVVCVLPTGKLIRQWRTTSGK